PAQGGAQIPHELPPWRTSHDASVALGRSRVISRTLAQASDLVRAWSRSGRGVPCLLRETEGRTRCGGRTCLGESCCARAHPAPPLRISLARSSVLLTS